MIESLVPLGIVGLIFGGCCSNVFALEAIVKEEPDSGLLITLSQFLLVCTSLLPSKFSPSSPYFLKPDPVPFRKWAASAAMFFAVNMLNNWAFAFDISVPVHIILRSFGSVTTMGAGWVRGKRYSRTQVGAVGILTVGVCVAAWADAVGKGKTTSKSSTSSDAPPSFQAGLLILFAAQLLSAYMGVYVQDIYAEHGSYWRENLFYSHLLSLPLFLPLSSTLRSQYSRLTLSPPLVLPPSIVSNLPSPLVGLAAKAAAQTPRAVAMLSLNSLAQLLCISGVNLLSAKTSAVTVTIVLNVRKLVSFIFSVWLFGNEMSGMMVVGSALVFGAGALYGWETSVGIPRRRARADKEGGKKKA